MKVKELINTLQRSIDKKPEIANFEVTIRALNTFDGGDRVRVIQGSMTCTAWYYGEEKVTLSSDSNETNFRTFSTKDDL